MAVVRTQNLTMMFGPQRALDSLNLEIGRGVTGLVGANGAGKTTLMSLILGLRAPTEGALQVLGMDPRADGTVLRSRVGYAPERHVLPDDMPASDFVKHLAEVRGMPRSEARSRASDALWLVGLGEERFRPCGTMSTGQRQRVKLAQALAADPQLVLLDEPTDGLDPVQRDDVLALIRSISTDYGIDILLSSHLLEEVERICDRIVALDAGRLVAQGAIDDLTGSNGQFNVELHDPADLAAVMASLTAAGWSVSEPAGASFFVVGDEPDRLADAVRDAVAERGARLRRLGTRRRHLEDLFTEAAS